MIKTCHAEQDTGRRSKMSYCEWCGSSRHQPEDCPTRELSRALTGKKYDAEKLPDYVSMMPLADLLEKTGQELHDEVKNLSKISSIKKEVR